MSQTHVAPVPPPVRHRRDGLWGKLLFVAALIAFLAPWPHDVLASVGSADGRTLDSAGYRRSVTVPSQAAPRPKKGDDIFGSLLDAQKAASNNKAAADRRLLCLALGLPGAYLLGRSRRYPALK